MRAVRSIVKDLFTILVLVLLPAHLARLVNRAVVYVRVLTRGTYLCDSPMLRAAGANAVFSSEGEIALWMTEFPMRRTGATDERIDRERDRIWTEPFQTQR